MLALYGSLPFVATRLARRFPAKREDYDPTRPGASLRMAGALVLGWGIVALAFQWWWFSAVAIVGGAVLQLWGRARRRGG